MVGEGFYRAWQWILDCVFPQSCLGCGQDDVFLCSDCRGKITSPGLFEEPGEAIAALYSLTSYQPNSVSGSLIESLKYNFSALAGKEITHWLNHSEEILKNITADLIIPIPLHSRRYAERGFNQAKTIAQPIALYLKKPLVVSALQRIKPTKQQALLGKNERIKNMTEAFVVKKNNLVSGKTCLLVDDVYTTGSTMQAAAKALLEAGATRVIGFTLARAKQ